MVCGGVELPGRTSSFSTYKPYTLPRSKQDCKTKMRGIQSSLPLLSHLYASLIFSCEDNEEAGSKGIYTTVRSDSRAAIIISLVNPLLRVFLWVGPDKFRALDKIPVVPETNVGIEFKPPAFIVKILFRVINCLELNGAEYKGFISCTNAAAN